MGDKPFAENLYELRNEGKPPKKRCDDTIHRTLNETRDQVKRKYCIGCTCTEIKINNSGRLTRPMAFEGLIT